jgi:hypothetical protein
LSDNFAAATSSESLLLTSCVVTTESAAVGSNRSGALRLRFPKTDAPEPKAGVVGDAMVVAL